MPPRAWLLPLAAAIVAPPDYDPDLLSCRERCEMLTDCDVRTWEETVAIRECQKECPYDPEENIIPFTREDCHTISKRRGRDVERGSGEDGCLGGCPEMPFGHVYTNDLRAMHASGELNNVGTHAYYHERDRNHETCFRGMDCFEEPDWGSIVDAELAETKVKIGQGEDYRPVLEPEMLKPVVDGLDVLEEVKAETERDSILKREDEIREMHAAALRAQEEREYWNELAKADAEAAKRERERVLAIEKRVEAEAAAAAQRRVREEALLDAVLGWTDAAGERKARLLARSAERAAEEAAKVIDGMDDVVEATQAKNDAIALGESIDEALDELVAPSIDAVDAAMAAFEDPIEDAIAAPLDPTLRYADDDHDEEDPYVPDLGDWEEEDAVDGLAAPAKPRPPPPRRKKGEPKPPARRGRRDDATIRKLEERLGKPRRPRRLDGGAPSENATDTNATDAVLEQKLAGIVDEVLAPIDPGLPVAADEPELTLPVGGEPIVDNIL